MENAGLEPISPKAVLLCALNQAKNDNIRIRWEFNIILFLWDWFVRLSSKAKYVQFVVSCVSIGN